MAPPTDGRPEEEFLRNARRRIEAREASHPTEDDQIPTLDALVQGDDLDVDDHTLVDNDPRVPPWWRIRRHPAGATQGITLAVILVVAISVALIGAWALATGELPDRVEIQPSPHILPGEEDYGQPVRRRPF